MDTAEIIMYPIKQRIFRYFLIHETGSVDEIKKSISRVLSASLYRHIKISANSSVLEAAGENRIAVGYMKRKAAKVGKMRQCGKSALKNWFDSCYTSVTGVEPVAPTKQNFA